MEHCLEIVDASHLPRTRDPQSTHSHLLRASWIRGDGRGASGGMPTDHLHAQRYAVILWRTCL